MKFFHLVFACLLYVTSHAQAPSHLSKPSDSLKVDAFLNTVDQSLLLFYAEYAKSSNYDSIINALNYEPGEIPKFTDDEICKQLEKLNEVSPFHLDCNTATLNTIKFFAAQRRGFIKVALGRSQLYFDLFEEKLAEYGLPLELKYLPIIESGLRPQVKSRAGALGLWQFMYRTGLYYGLKENSYIDERMDPVKATDAACRYLRQLYGIYGDWNLALAAYNAGPGNINKAIRRSGNKTTYWQVRPFMPSETQGYVPNFIAAVYLMKYHAEYNLVPMEAKIHHAQLDTMCLNSGVHMQTIEKIVKWPLDDIKSLNPIYKTTYIPKWTGKSCISGPLDKIGLLVSLEDSLYKLEKALYRTVVQPTPTVITNVPLPEVNNDSLNVDSVVVEKIIYHKVKSGENLTQISAKYKVSSEQIMEWNALKTPNIYVGQRLKIYNSNSGFQTQPETPVNPTPVVRVKYYNVRTGDTFHRIAQRHGLTQNQLRKLNPGINIERLVVGQRIRVK